METKKGPNEANDDDSGEFSTQKERILRAITEDSLFDLSCSSEEEDNLDPIHFLPIGSSTLKEYETAADSAKKRASSDGKRTSTKLKLSDVDPKELILRAAEKGRVDLVDYSLDKDISLLRSTDADGYTPLHRACYNGHEEVVRTLLRRGADVLARTSDGWQPLHNACRWAANIVQFEEGKSEQVDQVGCYVVGQTTIASILLQNGAVVNAQTNGLLTPLHLAAAISDETSTLELLLNNRLIDATLTNQQGETAFEIARRSGKHYELFEMVEDYVDVK